MTGLEQVYVSLRSLCRALLDRTYFVPPQQVGAAYDPEVREELAAVLEATARAVAHVGDYTAHVVSADEAVAATDAALDEVDRSRDRLAGLLQQGIDPGVDAASWQQHGALLASVDRLRVELRAAVEPTDESWRPLPVTQRQREAVRHAAEVQLKHLRSHPDQPP